MTSYEAHFDYEAALHACARGERQALQRLYHQESARLLGVVLRIVRDRARAEDIVHDAFIKVWAQAHRFDAQRGSARGWIFTLTRHLALNQVRNGAREVQADPKVIEAYLGAPDDMGGTASDAGKDAGKDAGREPAHA